MEPGLEQDTMFGKPQIGGYILAGLLLVEYVEFVWSDYDVYLLKLDQNGTPE